MILCLYLIALADRVLVGEFLDGEISELQLLLSFCAALILTMKGIQSRQPAMEKAAGRRNPWDIAQYYSFLFSNIVVLLVAVLFHPALDGMVYSIITFIFALPATLHMSVGFGRNIKMP